MLSIADFDDVEVKDVLNDERLTLVASEINTSRLIFRRSVRQRICVFETLLVFPLILPESLFSR